MASPHSDHSALTETSPAKPIITTAAETGNGPRTSGRTGMARICMLAEENLALKAPDGVLGHAHQDSDAGYDGNCQ